MNSLNDEVIKINNTALNSLSTGDILTAQNLFKENAKRNICFLTLHNLGIFYIQEGVFLKNGRMRNARKLGMQYLQKAKSIESSTMNLITIAVTYLESKEYEKAVYYFEQASKTLGDHVSSSTFYNNFGKALYLANLYKKAAECFLKALNNCVKQDEKLEINISYSYALLNIDMITCRESIDNILQTSEYYVQMPDMDIFVLLYLCRDFQVAQTMCKPLLDKYHLDSSVIAMIFDCLIKLGKPDDAEECLQLQIESLEGYNYDVRTEIKNATLAIESYEFRKKLIADYHYMPPTMKQCYYIGCSEHNPL